MVATLDSADLLRKIEAVLAKLDESKPTQALMADICFALRSLLKQQPSTTYPTATGLKPKRNRAAYFRAYRLKVKASRSLQ